MDEEKREGGEQPEESKPVEQPVEQPAEEAQQQESPAEEKTEEKEEAKAEAEAPEEAVPVEEKAEEGEEVKEEAPEEAAPVEEKPEEEEKAKAEEEARVEEEVEAEKPQVLGDRKWYVIQTFTGQEDRVKQAIEQTIESKGLKEKVFQVLVPTEEIVEIKGGKRLEKVKKMFPGYVFLEMILDEESWYLIRETPGVARFIGSKIRPTPVSGKEMQRVLKQLGKEERLEITFEKGEGVRVISGPFRGYTGTVDEVNPEKGKLKVLINIFGRDTPVEVNFEHAQKIV
jgi:transcriptional antiterminator NusG